MSYTAIKGGERAIDAAEELVHFFRLKGNSRPLEVRQIMDQMRLAVDQVMGEGSLYAPYHAALALKQAEGDTIEASFLLRAYRSTLERLGYSIVTDISRMLVIRRISAAFKDIPGGQILGPTRDYSLRLLNFDLAEEDSEKAKSFISDFLSKGDGLSTQRLPLRFPKVIEILRAEGLLEKARPRNTKEGSVPDLTREPLTFPAARQIRLQAMARAEKGSIMALAYSTMRGYGNVHPTLGELRVGYVPLVMDNPIRKDIKVTVGWLLVTEAEVITSMDDAQGTPRFTLGYGLCFGQDEIKAISMAVLDRAMQAKEAGAPGEDDEFVLCHIDGIDSSGFTAHWKLPHYVTFQSALDRLRRTQQIKKREEVMPDGTPEYDQPQQV
ncbi:carbon-phosphorus lyase complex subunit PhnI [Acetomicrobium sp. S15 = DSM 107314]|uniref:carbon-phosphorus lyase complex subunit PhnI n=1 Tax=Acetomicrobium sp. S15 = DSM 107314 TaxID=2529858 RepID=UPI0018E0F7E4|nr:carbon-phosphorus lyase complex subunit PhnI [Acetomicrobium sp. S15 = DSM 107314]